MIKYSLAMLVVAFSICTSVNIAQLRYVDAISYQRFIQVDVNVLEDMLTNQRLPEDLLEMLRNSDGMFADTTITYRGEVLHLRFVCPRD